MTDVEIFRAALDKWGLDGQLLKLAEECCELGTAAFHFRDGKIPVEDIVTELADVDILLDQMRFVFDGISEERRRKLDRLRERLEHEQK